MLSRRTFLSRAAGLVALLSGRRLFGRAAPNPGPAMTVYRSPTCACCAKWVDHVRANGFTATVRDEPDLDAVKDRLGVPRGLRSCHTARVDGYLVEGHVPAEDIRRLLRERPGVAGLAVPGMPMGTPGMEQPGAPAEPYEVLAFARDGATRVYARH